MNEVSFVAFLIAFCQVTLGMMITEYFLLAFIFLPLSFLLLYIDDWRERIVDRKREIAFFGHPFGECDCE